MRFNNSATQNPIHKKEEYTAIIYQNMSYRNFRIGSVKRETNVIFATVALKYKKYI